MWVIYNADTGMEFCRTESTIERTKIIEDLLDNEFGDRYEYRYEE